MSPDPPRDFTYITPRKRRLSEYEAVSLYVQPDLQRPHQHLFMRDSGGRHAWRTESTRLRHPDWYAFRDPARQWQRTYVRMQAEQERAIERLVEDATAAGAFDAVDRAWLEHLLGEHYRVWSFFEYGLFRSFAVAQREALADTIGNALCFQGFDHMRHAQAIVLYLLDLEQQIDGFSESPARERWLEDERYQPLRRLVEELIVLEDWGELCIAANLAVLPWTAEIGVSALLRANAASHGDLATPVIALTTERDRRRNIGVSGELVRMALEETNPDAAANRAQIEAWLERWTERARAAAAALAPLWGEIPHPVNDFAGARDAAEAAQQKLLAAHGLGS